DARAEGRGRFYRARRQALGALGHLLEAMWDDALWKLKLAAELEATRRGPARRSITEVSNRTPQNSEAPPMSLATLPHQLDRTVVINASRDVVFRYFTDSTRWAARWGSCSWIDARPGG